MSGSTDLIRGHVLATLGVLTVATADQMRRLMQTAGHDGEPFHTACLDLAREGLTELEGSPRVGNQFWRLTPKGVEAAAEILSRSAGELRGSARGAFRSGALHTMTVNETVIAITRASNHVLPTPLGGRRRTRSPDLEQPGDPVPVPQGIGCIGSWATHTPLALTAGREGSDTVRADAVLQAPEAGAPVLFVVVDNCTEPASTLAAKLEKYLRYFRLQTRDPHGREIAAWRTRYLPTGREGHPPVAVVFNPGGRVGCLALRNRMAAVQELTRPLWSGRYRYAEAYGSQRRDGYYDYTDVIPIMLSTLEGIQASGPRGAVWWRCGHRQWQSLPEALANPADHDAWFARDEQRRLTYNRDSARRLGRADEREPTAQNREPEPAWPCAWCGGMFVPSTSWDLGLSTPEDGRHCPSCWADLRRQYPTLRRVLERPSRIR
ncbi:replication-relaxation family protein [Streptomyces fructofermentans]|uniref:replication-relaxation family protein n=1 Tax=Streptomyces fructofermentans TaxID=152141 RepID=UPI0034102A1A